MRKLLRLLFVALLVLLPSEGFAQSVSFQRFSAGSGTVSTVPALGPATSLVDLAGGLANARMSGVATNGAGLIFYADRAAGQILAVDSTSNVYAILLPLSGVSNPQAISLDLTSNFLYVADAGNSRIVRVNLSQPLPASKVQLVVDPAAGFTDGIGDLKYNPSDGYLYWTNNGTLHRAAVLGQPMPVQSGETVLSANSIGVSFFDFDLAVPQNIFFSSGSGGFEGIFTSPLPRPGQTPNLTEVRVLDTSATPDVATDGIAVDKNGPFLCYTSNDLVTPAPAMHCGDRTTTSAANFPVILSSEFTVPPNFMVIDSPSSVVAPDTKLGAPILQLNLTLAKPEVLIILRQFDDAVLKAIGNAVAHASGGTVDFRYVVEMSRTGDAKGKPLPDTKRELRELTSKKNLLTSKNLKRNSTYQVRYNIEITRKQKGQSEKVVKKTRLSPFSRFVVPKK